MTTEEEIEGRAERLKRLFPGAYTEKDNGIVAFDMAKVSEALGLFQDWIIDAKGNRGHSPEGNLYFRIRADFKAEVVVTLPIQVGNSLSSWSFLILARDWRRVVEVVEQGLQAAETHIKAERERKGKGKNE